MHITYAGVINTPNIAVFKPTKVVAFQEDKVSAFEKGDHTPQYMKTGSKVPSQGKPVQPVLNDISKQVVKVQAGQWMVWGGESAWPSGLGFEDYVEIKMGDSSTPIPVVTQAKNWQWWTNHDNQALEFPLGYRNSCITSFRVIEKPAFVKAAQQVIASPTFFKTPGIVADIEDFTEDFTDDKKYADDYSNLDAGWHSGYCPKKVGVYLTRNSFGAERYSKWDGMQWLADASTEELADLAQRRSVDQVRSFLV